MQKFINQLAYYDNYETCINCINLKKIAFIGLYDKKNDNWQIFKWAFYFICSTTWRLCDHL